ncbi:MAG: hypothetical protein ACR2OR_02705 [Hyphomicrobiales bacterium]
MISIQVRMQGALILALALLGVLVLPSHAAEPGYYIVQNAPAGDTLNLREEPMGSVLRTFENGALVASSGKEQTRNSTNWIEVSSGESQGWVAARFVRPAEPVPLMQSRVPVNGSCGGFEPGWNFSWEGQEAKFSTYDSEMPLTINAVESARGFTNPNMITASSQAAKVQLILSERACTALPVDGFVWGVANLILSTKEGTHLFHGCCRPIEGGYK